MYRNLAEQTPHLLQAGPQFGVADLDREHRVLQRRERAIRPGDAIDGAVEEALHAVRRSARRRREELLVRELVACGKLLVGALRAAESCLD